MTNIRNMIAACAAMAITVAGPAFAQDDLDDLLKDLDSVKESGETDAKAAEASAEKAEEKVAKKAEEVVEKAEEKVEEAAAAAMSDDELPEAVDEEEPAEVKTTKDAAADLPEATDEEEPAEVKTTKDAAADLPEATDAEEKVEAAKEAEDTAAAEKKAETDSLLEDLRKEDADEESVAEKAEDEKPAEEKAEEAAEEKAEEAAEEKAEEAAADEAEDVVEEEKPAATVANLSSEDAELVDNLRKTEELRRAALDNEARREINEAENAMLAKEYTEAVRHYTLATKLLNDSPNTRPMRKKCQEGIAEGLYRAALQENELGRRERALKLIEKAVSLRHPKARRQMEIWQKADDPNAHKVDLTAISQPRNAEKFKQDRAKARQHLKRSKYYLGLDDLDRALMEVEMVIKVDKYNKEAIALRHRIEKKKAAILQKEFEATREGMIADVGKAWRPVYAVDADEIDESVKATAKVPVTDDPRLKMEQSIEQRMKDMRLPAISFKPPATIIDAVDYFRQASKDYDRPDLPVEKRGFNFVIRLPKTIQATAGSEESETDDFTGSDSDEAAATAQSGVPVIPMITASDITFYEALKLVCDTVDYKFKVQGPVVMVMHKDMTVDEMQTRSYNVLDAFLDRIGSAASDMREMRAQGFGNGGGGNDDDGGEHQEKDWKAFFEQMGVKWPEGSSIMYIKTIGKLRVRNTSENLAIMDQALAEMNVTPTLVEIETRFVEVAQEDLNSLGFEWILNSDYSLDLNHFLGRALGIRRGSWKAPAGSGGTTETTSSTTTTVEDINAGGISTGQQITTVTTTDTSTYTPDPLTSGNRWSRQPGHFHRRNIGISSFGGADAEFGNTGRYLSTVGNHISGEAASKNDQFMKLNAFLGQADLSMILHMLSQRSDTDLLSAPKVVTKSGENAVIKVVTEYIYPQDYDVQLQSSSSSSSSSSSGGSQSAILAVVEPQNFTMREVGVILDVTPTVTADGAMIDLELKPQVVDEPTWKNYGMKIPFTGNSSLQNFEGLGGIFDGLANIFTTLGNAIPDTTKALLAQQATDSAMTALDNLSNTDSMTYYDAPMEQPFFHVRSIDSKVSIYNGATVVMGGLITEQRKAMDDKVPFLGDLPFVGRLFRSHAEQTIKRNLLIFVTARLIDPRGRTVNMGTGDDKSMMMSAEEATPVTPAAGE